MSFKNKRLSKWITNDVVDWVKSIGLSEKWTTIMVNAITETECIGKDFMSIKMPNDISDSFDIKIATLCNKVFEEIEKVKQHEIYLMKKAIKTAASKSHSHTSKLESKSNEQFRLNLFGQNKLWRIPTLVTENTTVKQVAQLYRDISGLSHKNIDHIKLCSRGRFLQNHRTLAAHGIRSENHLIIVIHGAMGS
eukprot:343837_1